MQGQHLDDNDQVMVLDTCGFTSGAVERFTAGGRAADIGASGQAFAWDAPTAAGGQYRICWCASGQACSTGDEFRMDVGQLTLVGPRNLQQWFTCVSGQTCKFDGITGEHLSVENAFMALDTCGVNDPTDRKPDAGSFQAARSGAALSFGQQYITASAGSYRLCWCGYYTPHTMDSSNADTTRRCSAAEAYKVAEAPWSVAEWAVAFRFDNPRATVLCAC